MGALSFGGPPAQVALLRDLTVERRRWLDAREFEDANAATQLLPGPAGTQLAIYCAMRVGGTAGAILGGLAFILPGLLLVLAISALALADSPPEWILGIGAGAAAAVVAVVAQAGIVLTRSSLEHRRDGPLLRAIAYVAIGAAATVVGGRRARARAARPAGSSSSRGAAAAGRRGARLAGGARARRHRGRGAAGAGLDGAQGRRALVRRRLRDHPADAGGRRRDATAG